MYQFHNDYNETCHNTVYSAIGNCRDEQLDGYGLDVYSRKAVEKIKLLCENKDLSIHFLAGGTQTNLTVISSALRPHQAVLAAESGHINVHETGAIEATGHKVVTIPSLDGKISAEVVAAVLDAQKNDDIAEHTVQIKMLYISNPTELGTLYTADELRKLSAVCKAHNVYLYMDGARLSYALAAITNDVTLPDLAKYCDVFYIGGTKCGAMFGEAVVISHYAIAEDFRYLIKQHGALLAKGWLLGVQFDALLSDNLYFEIAKNANRLADRIRQTLVDLHCPMYVEGATNQIFPILPNRVLDCLASDFTYMVQQRVSETHTAVRFCTSWATEEADVDALCNALRKYY